MSKLFEDLKMFQDLRECVSQSNSYQGGWSDMIGPGIHPQSLLKRKHPAPDEMDLVPDVCSYETIDSLGSLQFQEQGSPSSLESGYHTVHESNDEDSNLSWLLNFKVSSLFVDGGQVNKDRPPDTCQCAGVVSRSGPGKPPFTYTELIEKALKEQGELTVSGIYTWISSNFPYYNPSDDRWKNSVRHNLSINPHFRKGVKSRHGAGHLWTLSNEGVSPPPESWKRCRSMRSPSPDAGELVDEAALAAASIMPLDPPLTRVAEEILSGVKRRVEVQYLSTSNAAPADSQPSYMPDHTIYVSMPPSSLHSFPHYPEFLNPVSKEELVSESGLDTSCAATNSLLSELTAELHLPDNLFSDELAFTCYSQL